MLANSVNTRVLTLVAVSSELQPIMHLLFHFIIFFKGFYHSEGNELLV